MPPESPEYRFARPAGSPSMPGARVARPSRRVVDGMIVERDAEIALRDGTRLCADVFRPLDERQRAAPILVWGAGGPEGAVRGLSRHAVPGAPDPGYWTAAGYAVVIVSPRGTGASGGEAGAGTAAEAADLAEAIGWAAGRAWSGGRVGLAGAGPAAAVQWRVAEAAPPALAAIAPWEGWTDPLRERDFHGGIPVTGTAGEGADGGADGGAGGGAAPPHDDASRAALRADPGRVRVPVLAIAGPGAEGQARAAAGAFGCLAPDARWFVLDAAAGPARFDDPGRVALLRGFFDRFLLGREGGTAGWPPVRIVLSGAAGPAAERGAADWPPPGAVATPLWLDAAAGVLAHSTPADEDVVAVATGRRDAWADRACFVHRFARDTDLAGPIRLRLWVSTEAGADADLFVALRRIGSAGAEAPEAGPGLPAPFAQGWLRASERALDAGASTALQPVLRHAGAQPLPWEEADPVEIEVWPAAARFRAGEGFRLEIGGADPRPLPAGAPEHGGTVNRGPILVHAGGRCDSFLLLPLMPPETG